MNEMTLMADVINDFTKQLDNIIELLRNRTFDDDGYKHIRAELVQKSAMIQDIQNEAQMRKLQELLDLLKPASVRLESALELARHRQVITAFHGPLH